MNAQQLADVCKSWRHIQPATVQENPRVQEEANATNAYKNGGHVSTAKILAKKSNPIYTLKGCPLPCMAAITYLPEVF